MSSPNITDLIQRVYNVRDYGARATGNGNDQPAILQAMTIASLAGGGVVVVPPGAYALGSNVVFTGLTSVLLVVYPGVTIAGSGTFPTTGGTNCGTLDYRSGTVTFNGAALFANPMTTAADMIVGGASGVATRLPKGAAYQALGMDATAAAQAWMASLQSLIAAAGDLIYGSGANTPAKLAAGTSNQVLHSGTTPSWGSVATGDLAANAVTQNGLASGSTSSPTTASTTYVDMPDMAVTLTTTGGDLVAILVSSVINDTAAQLVALALSLDAATEVGRVNRTQSADGDGGPNMTFWRFTGVSAGSHTVKGRWLVSGGTGTLSSTLRQLLVIELKK